MKRCPHCGRLDTDEAHILGAAFAELIVELVAAVRHDNPGLSQAQIEAVVVRILDNINADLAR